MDCQDWEPVVLSKRRKATPHPLFAAQSQMSKVTRKALEEDGHPGKVDTIDHNTSQRIQQARSAKGMTRKELAQRIGVKDTLLADYENGKAIPNASILNKIERVVGRSVRRD